MDPDWTTFFAERDSQQQQQRGTGMKYSRVKASNAAALLEKWVLEFFFFSILNWDWDDWALGNGPCNDEKLAAYIS
jgi:hypothetical protein